jgi:hypothetical protein
VWQRFRPLQRAVIAAQEDCGRASLWEGEASQRSFSYLQQIGPRRGAFDLSIIRSPDLSDLQGRARGPLRCTRRTVVPAHRLLVWPLRTVLGVNAVIMLAPSRRQRTPRRVVRRRLGIGLPGVVCAAEVLSGGVELPAQAARPSTG